MLKILHLADVHFDGTFRCRSARLRGQLRDAIRVAFVRAMDVAVSERVDAVLLAGDLFDGERLSFTTEKILVDQFRRLREAGIPVFWARGNHDPASLGSRAGSVEWPDNCSVFSSVEPQEFDILSAAGVRKGVVVGAGHEMAHEEKNLAASFPPSKGGVPHVGLLHTMVTTAETAESHDRYAPCSVDDLMRSGYDYWALGHIHQRQSVDPDERAWYSGNLQGRNPRETGPKGGLVVHIEHGRSPEVQFVPLAPIEWINLRLSNLSAVRNLTDLESVVEREFARRQKSESADDCIVVVYLEGECDLAGELRVVDAVQELEALLADQLSVAGVEIRMSNLASRANIDDHKGEPHVLGEVLRSLSRFAEVPEAMERITPAELAMPITPSGRAEYLRELLDGLDGEAVRRLLQSD